MINLDKAEKQFKQYVAGYDASKEPIVRKIGHCLRVAAVSEQIAKQEGLSEENVGLAKLIGLLHDIARFEQYTQYGTFADWKSIDHGDLGVSILFEQNQIRKYIEEEKYDTIIEKAIRNHNKYAVEKNVTPEEKEFCHLVRDADKIDIFYNTRESLWKDGTLGSEEITPEVIEQVENHNTVEKQLIQTEADELLQTIALAYDINKKASFRILKEKKYIIAIANKFHYKNKETEEKIKQVARNIEQYIEDKAK